MKKLKCNDFGGCCDEQITGNSFEEVGKKIHAHVMEQIKKGDKDHRDAASRMRNTSPEKQKTVMAQYRKVFDDAPNIKIKR